MSLESSAVSPLQSYGGQAYGLQQVFDNWLHRVLREGYVRDVELCYNLEHFSVDVIVRLLDGERLIYCMTRDELMMASEPSHALMWFLSLIDDEIRRYVSEHPGASQRIDEMWRAEHLGVFGSTGITAAMVRLARGTDWDEAHRKAKELFKLAAGKEAFERLDRMGELQLTGSLGTQYILLKQSTYSVLRPKDGAKLCAVVPGVPLWDHLLGLKLMIEHDEPRFLATANVAGGRPNHFNCRSALSISQPQLVVHIDSVSG